MSRINFFVVPFVFILILSFFFFFSANLFKPPQDDSSASNELLIKKFLSFGKVIAHATFVEDAIAMDETFNLDEIISQIKRDESEIIYFHFTDANNKVISSTDEDMVDKTFNPEILKGQEDVVKENKGIYEGTVSIKLAAKKIGAIYFAAKPEIFTSQVANKPNPIVLAIGIVIAIIASFITFSMTRGFEAKLVDDINKRQEQVFSPKIEALKKEQQEKERNLREIAAKIGKLQESLKKLNDEYSARQKEIAANPVAQSVEKLKAAEAEILKRLETLKNEEAKLNNEITLLGQKREEIRMALEGEKKEEAVLHERLDLIKKKILHLETPGK